MTRYHQRMTAADKAALLAECNSLDVAYAESQQWHAERAPNCEDVDPDDHGNPMAELRKAALCNGHP